MTVELPTLLYHQLFGVGTMDALQAHPRISASWEGFVLEKVIAESCCRSCKTAFF